MKSNPYKKVRPDVAEAVEKIISGLEGYALEYHTTHKARLARTASVFVEMNPRGKVLELGASEFFALLIDEMKLPVELTVTRQGDGQDTDHEYWLDLEHDKIPCEDEKFDYVLCCEVIEHMEIDPMFMTLEMNRVMKVGASLLLTTPNVTSSRGLFKMKQGREPYFYMQYHRNRSYHRHNYEYSVPTLSKLMWASGFHGDVWTEDLFEDGLPGVVEECRVAGFNVTHVGDNILCRLKKSGVPIDYSGGERPDGLYV